MPRIGCGCLVRPSLRDILEFILPLRFPKNTILKAIMFDTFFLY